MKIKRNLPLISTTRGESPPVNDFDSDQNGASETENLFYLSPKPVFN